MRQLRWPLLLISGFLTALFLAWHLLSAVNFLYPMWYKTLGIDDTIRIYGPQNHNRHGFERTDAAEHARLFAAIVKAVENHGQGLEGLEYRDAQGHPIDRLLTPPEITHLRDVSRLIASFQWFGWINLVITIALSVSMGLKPAPKPAIKKYMLSFVASIALITGAVLALGAKDVFYKFHTWIFPAGHQWFFYYRDSLMTTLMKAPVLFAGIAVEWLVLTLVIYGLLLVMAWKWLPRRA